MVAVTRDEDEGPDLEVIKPFEGAPALRAQLDALMTIMIKEGASDLHLRVGEPALLRLHGEMERLPDQPVLDDKTLSGMLKSIMPDVSRRIRKGAAVVEFGAGSATKTPILLEAIVPGAYVPVDISGDCGRGGSPRAKPQSC